MWRQINSLSCRVVVHQKLINIEKLIRKQNCFSLSVGVVSVRYITFFLSFFFRACLCELCVCVRMLVCVCMCLWAFVLACMRAHGFVCSHVIMCVFISLSVYDSPALYLYQSLFLSPLSLLLSCYLESEHLAELLLPEAGVNPLLQRHLPVLVLGKAVHTVQYSGTLW